MSQTSPHAAPIKPRLLQNTILHDSLKLRWKAGAVTIAPFVVLCGILALALQDAAPHVTLLYWWSSIALTAIARIALGRYTERRLDSASTSRLQHFENLLRIYIAAVNFLFASAFWIINSNVSYELLVLLTIASCLYAAGLLTYHAVDLRGYLLGLVCNLGQSTLFWVIAAPDTNFFLIPGMLILFSATVAYQARLTQLRFRENVADRLNKRLLVLELERQKRAAESAASIAQKADDAKSLFLGAASHDLRQPIHALALLIETLSPMLTREDQRRVMNRIEDTAAALDSLFSNILDLSRFSANAITVRVERFNLLELLENLSEEFRGQIDHSAVHLHVRGAPTCVNSDPHLIERVLRNLLSNAVQHTSVGEISLHLENFGQRVRLIVSDTGPGIPLEHQHRVFEEFVQIVSPTGRRHAGVGLGLSIVRRIDSLLGLDLKMESGAETGTRFQMLLPRTTPTETLQTGQYNDAKTNTYICARQNLLRISIVDDDKSVREAMQYLFESWGHEVESYTNGRALLTAFRYARRPPILVFLDDTLDGDLTGLEVADMLVKEGFPLTQITIITGNSQSERRKALTCSPFRLWSKPTSADRFHMLLEEFSPFAIGA